MQELHAADACSVQRAQSKSPAMNKAVFPVFPLKGNAVARPDPQRLYKSGLLLSSWHLTTIFYFQARRLSEALVDNKRQVK